MGLWIRSQDKKNLINASEIILVFVIDKFRISSSKRTLGEYSTEKKALKVLDEIMSWIDGLEYARNTKSYRSTFVYQMPQDSKVKEND